MEKRTLSSIKHRAYRLKLNYKDPIYNNYWDDTKLKYLQQYYPIGGAELVHEYIPEYSIRRIKIKAHRLHIRFKCGWSDYDITILNKNQSATLEQLTLLIPNKTKAQIRKKCIELGYIQPTFKKRDYTNIDPIIIEYYRTEGKKCASRLSGVSEEIIRKRAKQLGIKLEARGEFNKKQIINDRGIIYKSIKDAAIECNIKPTTISCALKHPNRTAGGYHWRYIEEDEEVIE